MDLGIKEMSGFEHAIEYLLFPSNLEVVFVAIAFEYMSNICEYVLPHSHTVKSLLLRSVQLKRNFPASIHHSSLPIKKHVLTASQWI